MQISATLLSAYLYCPRKIFYERILKLTEPPKEALLKGRIRHEVYELINKHEELLVKNIQSSNKTEIYETYKNSYSQFLKKIILNNKKSLFKFNILPIKLFKQIQPLILNEAESRSNQVFSFIEKTNLFGDSLWNALEPKNKSEVFISSKQLKLRGIVDQISYYPNKIIPFELKTGNVYSEPWPSHKIQIGAYILILKENHNVNSGFIKYLDHNKSFEVVMNPFFRDHIIDIRDKVISIFEERKIPDRIEEKGKCAVCGLRNICFSDSIIKKQKV